MVLMGLKELEGQGLVSKLSKAHGRDEVLLALRETLDLETLRNPKVRSGKLGASAPPPPCPHHENSRRPACSAPMVRMGQMMLSLHVR